MTETLKAMNERLYRLELRMESEKVSPRQSVDAAQRKKWAAATTCWTCGRKGVYAGVVSRTAVVKLEPLGGKGQLLEGQRL